MDIFEEDLKNRNSIHCMYIAGLGYLGLNKLTDATFYLQTALDNDAAHMGAKIHVGMVEGW